MIGAISFFHSVPDDDLGQTRRLNLDRCTLSAIFQRKITTWDHSAIKALNPDLKVPANQPITVVRRKLGSSSTSLSSKYLDGATADATCSYNWDIGVGAGGSGVAPNWPADTIVAEGSGGVSGYIAANKYSIGYIDSGHGHAENLGEIALKNAAGKYITSKEANISAAGSTAVDSTLMNDFSKSWHAVDLFNQPGDKTWPICTFSYLYLRKNLAADGISAENGALAKAFATMVLSDEGQAMVPEFGFIGIPADVLAKARAEVAALTHAGAAAWTFETSTAQITGMGDRVFSVKRMAYADLERTSMASDISTMKAQVAALQANEVNHLHGSGTTNPSKFFWKIMDIMEERARRTVTMTYRAVGRASSDRPPPKNKRLCDSRRE
jgi:ABC-type phosphate transport system substrate-binding protein